jgi:cyanate permease
VYGAVAMVFSMLWWFSRQKEGIEGHERNHMITFGQAIGNVVRLRNVWLLCIATAAVNGCINGMLGFLPLHLRGLGWDPTFADSTLASFHAASMLFTIPIALLSDRIGSRRGVLMVSALLIGAGTGLLGLSRGILISVAVLIAGFSRDGFMAITMTAVMVEKGIGPRFAATAIGLNLSVIGIFNFFAPPVGNWLVQFGRGLPFIFWASLVVLGFTSYLFMRPAAAENTSGTKVQN